MRLTIVGCSGSFPSPQSPASCYLVEAPDPAGRVWRVLLDLGSGALGPLQAHVATDELDALLISHLHPDHFIDACGLYVSLHYRPGGPVRKKLPVHGPADAAERLLHAYGVDAAEGLAETFAVSPWTDGEPVRIGPFTITPRLVDHPVEAYALRVEAGGRVLAYSGDTDACPGLDEVAEAADLFLVEASFEEGRDEIRGVHLTGRRAGEAAFRAAARRTLLTHIPAWTNPQTVLAEAAEVYPGDLSLATPNTTHQV